MNFFTLVLTLDFLGMFPQAKATKGKIKEGDYIELCNFCTVKKPSTKPKGSLLNAKRYLLMIKPVRG